MEITNVNVSSLSYQLEKSASIHNIEKLDNLNKNKMGERNERKFEEKDLKLAIDKANKVLFKNDTHLQFEIHEKTKDIMVKIIKDDTGEVLKEIPPEKFLDMVAKIWEIAGIFIDEKR